MFDFDDTEAVHLSEIYDGCEAYFEPYSTYERREYIRDKETRFKKSDIGKFVVVQKAKRNRKVMSILYLVDRKKTKRFWWSHDAYYAMVFEKESAAKYQAERYKYNNATVKQITSSMVNYF